MLIIWCGDSFWGKTRPLVTLDVKKLADKNNAMEYALNSQGNKSGPEIWSVAGGKGGVGKTFVSTSLGLTLSKLGYKTLVIDFDIEGANVHTFLGMSPSDKSLRQFLFGQEKLASLVQPTKFPNLSIIQGIRDAWAPVEVIPQQAAFLISQAKKLAFDYIVVDLSSGPNGPALEALKRSDEKILLTTPEPTSIEKTYRFIEAFISASLAQDSLLPNWADRVAPHLQKYSEARKSEETGFEQHLRSWSGFMPERFAMLKRRPVRILINGSRSRSDTELGYSIKSVVRKYFELNVEYLGAIDYDNAVWQSLKSMEPVLMAQPFTPLAGQFMSIFKSLVPSNTLKAAA